MSPKEMLVELCADNLQLTRSLRSTYEVSDWHYDVATASLLEVLTRLSAEPRHIGMTPPNAANSTAFCA